MHTAKKSLENAVHIEKIYFDNI